jgi:methionine biosynthesis protein MetW
MSEATVDGEYRDENFHARFRSVVKIVPEKSKVLDIACGSGTLMVALREKGCKCIGVDISSAAVRLSKSKGLEVYEADVDAFDTDDRIRILIEQPYDVVIFSKCLMYLHRKHELIRALDMKSFIVIQGNPYYWRDRLKLKKWPPNRIPYIAADGARIEVNSPRSLVRWGESFGYRGKLILGGFLRGHDMVIQFNRTTAQ